MSFKYGDMVTVAIASYNSADTIIETLNSVSDQSYKNIQLVISDDASSDNTVQITNNWCDEHKDRFADIIININEKNKGIPENVNTLFRLAVSDWIKPLSADDILLSNCIEDNVKFVVEHNYNSFLFSNVINFQKINGNITPMILTHNYRYYIHLNKLSPYDQYRYILKLYLVPAPSSFINKDMYEAINGCDDRIKYLEDWPLALRITKAGYKLNYMNKETVLYRYGNSVSRNDNFVFHERHISQVKLVKQIYIYPNIPKWHLIYYYEELILKLEEYLIIKVCKNKKNKLTRSILFILHAIKPNHWLHKFFSK